MILLGTKPLKILHLGPLLPVPPAGTCLNGGCSVFPCVSLMARDGATGGLGAVAPHDLPSSSSVPKFLLTIGTFKASTTVF